MKSNISVFIALLIFLVATSAIGKEQEDRNKCECWYDGYDTYPKTEEEPGGIKDECDLRDMKDFWEQGWKAHDENRLRECDYFK